MTSLDRGINIHYGVFGGWVLMIVSRRNEPFRYTFEPSLNCLIRLYEINHSHLESSQGEAEILDLSPNGCKLESSLNFRAAQNECKIVLSFKLVNPLELRGTIIWQEQKAYGFLYGVKFESDKQREITEELKQYSKQKLQAAAASASPGAASTGQ